jgi:hypothetical protein
MLRSAGDAAGWAAGFLAGSVWGVAFFSWGLPLSIPDRVVATVLLAVAFAAASRSGMLAAGAFTLGMGASSALLLASSGLLLADGWGLVSAAALAGGVGLHAGAVLRYPP